MEREDFRGAHETKGRGDEEDDEPWPRRVGGSGFDGGGDVGA